MKKIKSFFIALGICTAIGTALNVSADSVFIYSPTTMVAQATTTQGLRAVVFADESHFTQCQIKRLRRSDAAMVFVDGDSAIGTTSVENNDAVPNTQIGYAQALYYSDRSSYSTIIGEAYAASDR